MIVFHLGYPKCASTTLQKALFNAHSDIVNFGLYPTGNVGRDTTEKPDRPSLFHENDKLRQLHQQLVHNDSNDFDGEGARQSLAALRQQYAASAPATVFSNEGFLSVRFANPDIQMKLRRIHAVCPDARILVIIRNQMDVLKSLYRDHPYDPTLLGVETRPVSFSRFLELDNGTIHSHLASLEYDRLYTTLGELFGKDNTTFLPFEWLTRDLPRFAERLSEALGIDARETQRLMSGRRENIGPTGLQNRYRLLRKRLQPIRQFVPLPIRVLKRADRFISRTASGIGSSQKVMPSASDKALVAELYSEGNSLLSDILDIPLHQLGYTA